MAGGFTFSKENFRVGDLVKVMQVIKERDKEKTQVFEGKIIAVKGRAPNTTFTVRKIGVNNVGVERIFPLYSPTITKIVLKKSMPAKKAKLYYLRSKQ